MYIHHRTYPKNYSQFVYSSYRRISRRWFDVSYQLLFRLLRWAWSYGNSRPKLASRPGDELCCDWVSDETLVRSDDNPADVFAQSTRVRGFAGVGASETRGRAGVPARADCASRDVARSRSGQCRLLGVLALQGEPANCRERQQPALIFAPKLLIAR